MGRSSEEVREYISPVVGEMGLELVEVECKGAEKRPFLRVLIHRDGGVSVDDCNKLAAVLKKQFEEEDYFFPGKARLEVASPGLDRPLKVSRDFARNLGQKVRLFLSEPHDGRNELVGRIESVGERHISLLPENRSTPLELALAKISRGKLVIEF